MHYRVGDLWANGRADTVGTPNEQKAGASVVKGELPSLDGSHVDARAGQDKLPWAAQNLEP